MPKTPFDFSTKFLEIIKKHKFEPIFLIIMIKLIENKSRTIYLILKKIIFDILTYE
ncbi:MAG: hypothetical protein BAJALOKI3v1_1070014, partial [Promethearchaeota archaeon]